MLQDMLDDFRVKNPDDPRTDRQVLDSLMAFFLERGIVRRDPETRRYVVPELHGTPPDWSVRMAAHARGRGR
jgi:hypothetical protein